MSIDQLWMSVKRRGLNHHRLPAGHSGLHTTCHLYVGLDRRGEYGRGTVVDPAVAAELNSRPCPRCWPDVKLPRAIGIVNVELPEVIS